jgi:hypothetical protein
VFTLRCTQKLLTRLSGVPDPQPPAPDTVLGDWYANLVRVGRTQWVLAISEQTLLPLVLPARDAQSLVPRLVEALEPVLLAIGVPAEDAAAECQAMKASAIGKTASRRVLGSLNDLALELYVGMTQVRHRSLLEHAVWMAQTPMKVTEYRGPDEATVAAFAAHRVLSAMRLR